MKNLILIGAGGHAKSCIDVIECENKYKIIGLIDVKEKIGGSCLSYKIMDCDDNLEKYVNDENYFLVTIGHMKNPQKRFELFEKLQKLQAKIATVISPLAHVSSYAKIGEGSIVMHYVMVNVGAIVGKNCIINSKALIEHDSVIGDNCHISTACVINGEVSIGDECFIGSNATVANNVSIAKKTFIKATQLVK